MTCMLHNTNTLQLKKKHFYIRVNINRSTGIPVRYITYTVMVTILLVTC
jgi:hypothetical protein